ADPTGWPYTAPRSGGKGGRRRRGRLGRRAPTRPRGEPRRPHPRAVPPLPSAAPLRGRRPPRRRLRRLGFRDVAGRDREGVELAPRQARQHVDERAPALAVGPGELVVVDRAVEVLQAEMTIAGGEQRRARERHAAQPADVYGGVDAAALAQALDEASPVFGAH